MSSDFAKLVDPRHTIQFTVEDEGFVRGWKVVGCPGPEHCEGWIETGCKCGDGFNLCIACQEGNHYECFRFEDDNHAIAPGCSIKRMDTCVMAEWLDNIGADMIAGQATMTVKAWARWVGEYPVLEMAGPWGEETWIGRGNT